MITVLESILAASSIQLCLLLDLFLSPLTALEKEMLQTSSALLKLVILSLCQFSDESGGAKSIGDGTLKPLS